MNLKSISARVTAARRPKPDVRVKIVNRTRSTELAHRADVADSGSKRRKGLLGRDGLSAGEGLWISPCESVHTFGMRFAIDLVYLDRGLKVRKVLSHVRPWRISACFSAHSVLELASGMVHATETRRGDQLEFSAVPLPPHDDGAAATRSPAEENA